MPHVDLPLHTDIDLLVRTSGLDQTPWGFENIVAIGKIRLTFSTSKLDAVEAALAAYETNLLIDCREKRLKELANLRRQKILDFKFNGMSLPLDDNTQNKITGAVVYLQYDTSIESVDWEITRGNFVTLPRAHVNALGVAAGRHIQSCFSVVKDYTLQIMDMDLTRDQVLAIDLTQGWPV